MATQHPTRRRSFRSSPAFIIAAVCLCVFNDHLPARMIVPVLPAELVKHGHIPSSEVSGWSSLVVAGFGVSFLLFSPLMNYLADRWFAKRTILLSTMPIFAAGTLALMFLGSYPIAVVAARAVQGISSASVGVCALALLIDTVGASKAAIGMSSFQLTSNVVAGIGPLLAGTLFDKFGWRAIWIAPLCVTVFCALTLFLVREKPDVYSDKDAQWNTDEEEEIGVVCKSTTSLPDNIERTPLLRRVTGNGSGKDEVHEIKPQPGSVLDLVKNTRVIFAAFSSSLCIAVFLAMDTILPVFLYVSWSWNSTKTGWLFLACSVPKVLSPLTAKLVDRYGPRWPTCISFLISAGCLISMRVVEHESTTHIVTLIVLLCVTNVAVSTAQLAMMAEIGIVALEIKQDSGKDLAAQAGALISVTSTIGTVVGPILAGFIFQSFGWRELTLALGIACAVVAPGSLFFPVLM